MCRTLLRVNDVNQLSGAISEKTMNNMIVPPMAPRSERLRTVLIHLGFHELLDGVMDGVKPA